MNAKGALIAKLLSLGQGAPEFDVVTAGPPHERTFRSTVRTGGQVLGVGESRSKRDAERLASEVALHGLGGAAGPAAGPEAQGSEAQGTQGTAAPQGTWPIYSPVLAGALEAALDLCPEDASVDEVRAEAARLYRDLLAELGHGPE